MCVMFVCALTSLLICYSLIAYFVQCYWFFKKHRLVANLRNTIWIHSTASTILGSIIHHCNSLLARGKMPPSAHFHIFLCCSFSNFKSAQLIARMYYEFTQIFFDSTTPRNLKSSSLPSMRTTLPLGVSCLSVSNFNAWTTTTTTTTMTTTILPQNCFSNFHYSAAYDQCAHDIIRIQVNRSIEVLKYDIVSPNFRENGFFCQMDRIIGLCFRFFFTYHGIPSSFQTFCRIIGTKPLPRQTPLFFQINCLLETKPLITTLSRSQQPKRVTQNSQMHNELFSSPSLCPIHPNFTPTQLLSFSINDDLAPAEAPPTKAPSGHEGCTKVRTCSHNRTTVTRTFSYESHSYDKVFATRMF